MGTRSAATLIRIRPFRVLASTSSAWSLSAIDRCSRTLTRGIDVRNFAYPYGDLTFRTKHYLETRFDSCRSINLGINAGIADLGSLKAWPLENASVDRAKIAELITRTIESNGWLIFYSHDVGERPSK